MNPLGKLTQLIAKQIDKAGSAIEGAGIKNVAGVYIVTEDVDSNVQPTWLKLTPIPKLFYNINYRYGSGGQNDDTSLTLSRVSFDYTEEQLNTATTEQNKMKYYIIDNKPYVVSSIIKRMFYWEVTLMRFVTSQKTYTPPEDL